MKKILILQNQILHYRKPVFNGLARYYDVTILHSGTPSVGEDDAYREIITSVSSLGPFFVQKGVVKAVHSSHYDVVVAMFDIRWLANIVSLFLKGSSRFLYWGHRYSKSRLGNILRDFLMKKSDGVILYSGAEIDRIKASGMPESKLYIAHNTIHIVNASDGSVQAKNSFLYVGRAQKRKNVNLLIKAFSEILDQIPEDTKINIVGSGEENDYLRRLSDRLGLSDRVLFHGEIVDGEKLKLFFHSAYAYVSPGPVGLGVLHSFAYGVPVITCRKGKHGPEFYNLSNNENALLYENQEGLKEQLTKLCNDKQFSAKLGRNAYKFYARERSLEIMIKGFRAAIDSA